MKNLVLEFIVLALIKKTVAVQKTLLHYLKTLDIAYKCYIIVP
jgi:hypothetical protein